jgi:hypothetical protein
MIEAFSMVGRDALDGINEGLRSIGSALTAAGQALKACAVLCKTVTTNTTRASYDLVGEYTYPIEQELTKTQPPHFSDVPVPGIVVLFFPIILPTVILSVTVIPLVANSVIYLPRTYASFANVALLDTEEDQIKYGPDERGALRWLYGIPGTLLGGVAGFFSIPFILIGRVISNSCKSFAFPFCAMMDAFVPEKYAAKITLRDCSSFSHLLGGLGFLAGVISGMVGVVAVSVGRFLINTCVSAWRDFRNVTNYALPDRYRFSVGEDDRSISSIRLGYIGRGLGYFLGIFGAFLANSGRSMVASFKSITNLSLPTNMEFAPDAADERPMVMEELGILGLIPGGLAGALSFIAVGIARFFVNTVLGFWSALRTVTNAGLPAEKVFKPLAEDLQPDLRFGFLGYAFGAVAGAFAAFVASSAITFAGTFATMTNLALHADDKIKLGTDTRSTLGKCVGVLGFTGALFGLIGAFAVGVGRILLNLFSGAFKNSFFTYLNYGLPADEARIVPPFEKPWYFGVIGKVFGMLAGGVAALMVSGFNSFGRAFTNVANTALHPEDQAVLAEDKRTAIAKRLGYVGYAFGALAGLLVIPFIGIGRIITNTCKSFVRFFIITFNWGLPADGLNVVEEEKRNWASRVFGVLGIITGAVTGFLFAIGFSSYFSAAIIFTRMTNLVLDRNDAMAVHESKRNWGAHILGVPGIPLGFISGLIAMTTVAVARFFYHTAYSYLSLAGSLLNCSIRQAFFGGLGGDRRPLVRKLVGCLGYVAAAITVTPFALAIFVIRQIPSFFSFSLGIAFSPLVALYKTGGSIHRYIKPEEKRFSAGELMITSEASVIQGFKNIYSSLSSWGKLITGENVAVEADGSKSRWTFFRKSITFNARSVAERTLDTLLADYREFAAKDEGAFGFNFFQGEEFTASLQKVKEYYQNGCFVTKREIEDLHKEIDKLGNFIKTYFTDRSINQEVEIADVGPPGGLAWRVAFWGGERAIAQVAVEEQQPGAQPLLLVEEDEHPGLDVIVPIAPAFA